MHAQGRMHNIICVHMSLGVCCRPPNEMAPGNRYRPFLHRRAYPLTLVRIAFCPLKSAAAGSFVTAATAAALLVTTTGANVWADAEAMSVSSNSGTMMRVRFFCQQRRGPSDDSIFARSRIGLALVYLGSFDETFKTFEETFDSYPRESPVRLIRIFTLGSVTTRHIHDSKKAQPLGAGLG